MIPGGESKESSSPIADSQKEPPSRLDDSGALWGMLYTVLKFDQSYSQFIPVDLWSRGDLQRPYRKEAEVDVEV